MSSISKFLIVFLGISTGPVSWALPEYGQNVMITSTSREASEAGLTIAKKGGNAVDIAVATALALAVTRPYYAAFGGGGFALVKTGATVEALDFREMAPKSTSPTYYANKDKKASVDGGTAVGVPGIPMGLFELHKKYGKLHWSELFTPAIKLASEGFSVSGEWARITADNKSRFNQGGQEILFRKDGRAYGPGDILKQPGLAKLLKEMRVRGAVPFYSGMAARDVVDTVKAAGGEMTLEDLKNYKVRWLKPMTTKFEGYDLFLMPPPSSGGVVISTALKLVEKLKVKERSAMSVDELHLIGEILARSFRGRALLGDPDFHKNPIEMLLSEKYIDELAKSVSVSETKALAPLNEEKIDKETQTTHLSVMTASGEGVAMTITLNGNYGSGVVTPKFGIALNNEMDDFTTRPNEPNMFGLIQGKGNSVEPGKRPLSSMSPTLVAKDGKLQMVVGSPGGSRIISAVFQVVYRSLVTGWDMDKSIQAPRVHHQFLPKKLFVDPWGFAPETLEGLKKKGHEVTIDYPIAKVYGVKLNSKGYLEGAFDARGDGGAVGF